MSITKSIHIVMFFTLLMLSPVTFGAGANLSLWKESYDLEQAKNYKKAVQVLNPILKQNPDYEYLLLRLGWLNYLTGNYDESIKYYTKALNSNSSSLDARLGLTLPLLAKKNWKEAALYANQVIAVSAWDYTAHTRLMDCEAGQLQWATLENHASQVVLRYPSDATAFAYLAWAQVMLGKKEKAIATYRQVLERSPRNKIALDYLSKNS